VAAALAAAEPEDRTQWTRRFGDLLGAWRLLPDERLLARAGTGNVTWKGESLTAALNVAAFLRSPLTERASLNREALVESAELAVRMLDNAALIAGSAPAPALHIGLIGLADALALLGLSYRSDAARTQARVIGRALAEGCFRGSVRLACERGAMPGDSDATFARAQARGLPRALIEAGMRHGLRYHQLSAIASQPRLALLANNVADAIDPLPRADQAQTIDAPGGTKIVLSCGFALAQRRRIGTAEAGAPAAFETIAQVSVPDQLAMRAALQPWIDAPIDYPVRTCEVPTTTAQQQWQELAETLGLAPLHWRSTLEAGVTAP
jgi:ribonucleoside-diphosphate reductase alpha chain